MSIVFKGDNWALYEMIILIKASKCGRIGRQFIEKEIELSSRESSINSELKSNPPNQEQANKTTTIDINDEADSDLLFSEIISSVSEYVITVIHSRQEKEFRKCLLYKDYKLLWHILRNIALSWQAQIDYNCNISSTKKMKYSSVQAFKSIFTCDYIKSAWKYNADPFDLQSDVISAQANLALVGSLVLSFAFPILITFSNYDQSDYRPLVFTYLMSVSALTESASVLICIRNIVVMNLLMTENVIEFVYLSSYILLIPVTLNFIAIVSVSTAIVFWGLWNFHIYYVIFYMVAAYIPAACIIIYCITKGIQNFHLVQGWCEKDEK